MLQLPPELIIATLCHATLIDVVRCKQTCKTLNTVINESTALQYLIELGCTGYVDGSYDKDTLSQHERLRRLIEIETAWREFSLATKTKLELPGVFSWIYEFCGGVFIRGQSSVKTLNVIRFPSIFGNATSETWDLTQSQLAVGSVRDITIDPGSDLLIIIECREEWIESTSRTYDFHIRSLSTCVPHLAAQRSVITHLVPIEVAYVDTTVIIEDFFLALFSCASQDYTGGELVIWSWKSGEKVARLEGSFPPSTTCIFLSPAVFMIPQTEQITGEAPTLLAYLAVYTIPSSEEGEVVTPRLLSVYNMPVFSPGVIGCAMVVRFNPASSPQNGAHTGHSFGENPIHQSSSKPFYTDPLKKIFVIGMEVTHRGDLTIETGFTVFLHSDAFLRLLGEQTVRTGLSSTSACKNFKWDEYCKYARVIEHEPRASYIRFVHGQRYLDYEENSVGHRLHIWDFNSYLDNRRQPLARALPGDNPEETEMFNKGEAAQYSTSANDDEDMPNALPCVEKWPTGSTVGKWALATVYYAAPTSIENVVFQGKVWSSLPYRRITSRIKFTHQDGAMMDDERIILFRKNYSTARLELTVMCLVPEPSDQDKPDSKSDASGLMNPLCLPSDDTIDGDL
ncbi:hypothetical protein FRB93_007485 [Tulasnella sp. JGI-2019a]|nr:hypothetical protein FRB93_007485 [Tulasnella sp. JGI-2019a]